MHNVVSFLYYTAGSSIFLCRRGVIQRTEMIGVQRTELIEIQRPGFTRIHRPEIISIRVQRTGMIMVGQWFIYACPQ